VASKSDSKFTGIRQKLLTYVVSLSTLHWAQRWE